MEPAVFEEKPVEEMENGGSRRRKGPDGCSAWVVAIAACFINFIMAGLTRMSGILFVAFIDSFGVDRREAAMPFSVRSSTANLLGPLIGILGQKYGARAVILCGGVVATVSAAACFFAHSVTWLTVWWGGINGLSVALIVIMPQVVIVQYFDKYRTTASGMSFSGGCVGSFIFPVLLENLISSYGVEGTFLIIAGIMMNTIPAAMILKRPSWLPAPGATKAEASSKDIESAVVSRPPPASGTPKQSLSSVSEWVWESPDKSDSIKRFAKDGPSVHFLRQNSCLVVQVLTRVVTGDRRLDRHRVAEDGGASGVELHIWAELEDLFRYIQLVSGLRQDLKTAGRGVTPKGAAPGRRGCHFLSAPRADLRKSRSVPHDPVADERFPKNFVLRKLKNLHAMRLQEVLQLVPGRRRTLSKLARELRKLYNVCARVMRLETKVRKGGPPAPRQQQQAAERGLAATTVLLHRDPAFLLICACKVVHFVCYIPILTTVVDFVQDVGLGKEDGKYAIAALSLGDLVGRLGLGWVTDKAFLTMPRYMALGMVLQGASAASLPLMHTRATLFPVLALTGMLQGSLFARHPVLISSYMEPKLQSISMGCVNFLAGVIGLGIPTYIGYFRDTLGCYDHVFLINGSFGMLVGLLWLLESRLRT